MSKINDLFTERFRPRELENLIAPPRVKQELNKGLVQNLLLYGSAGTGKTSTLFILAQNHTFKYVNASSERGIDTIRESISRFCSSISLEGGKEKLKCVILDEVDGATEDFFKALRAVIERYSATTRFIASCNFIEKIPDAIKSRMHLISYDPVNKEEEDYLVEEYKTRVRTILNAAKIKATPEVLDKFVRNDFPDMRSLMNKTQSFYLRNIDELNPNNFNINYDYKDLFDLCLKKPEKPHENYKFVVSEYGSRVDDSLMALSEIPNYIKSVVPEKESKIPMIIITIAEYQYQKQFTINPLITLLAAIFKIQSIIHGT